MKGQKTKEIQKLWRGILLGREPELSQAVRRICLEKIRGVFLGVPV
jgi:hypothetical protein